MNPETIEIKTTYFKSSTMKLEMDAETKFYENDNLLTSSDDDEPFTKREFELKVQQAVSDFINQSFDNVVVLAGAGASVVVNDQGLDPRFGKTVEMIARNINLNYSYHPKSWYEQLYFICNIGFLAELLFFPFQNVS